MYNSTHEYEACVLVNGKPVTEVAYNGRTFIEGRKNSTYELSFRNNSSGRVLVVPSVDGLSVIDGKPCGVQSSGYVIEAWDSVKIPGWKVDGETAAKFNFKSQRSGQTYAESTGQDGSNQGVVGFMVFQEQVASIFWEHTPWKQNPWIKPMRPYPYSGDAPTPRWTSTHTRTGGFVKGSTTGNPNADSVTFTSTAADTLGIAPDTNNDVQCSVNYCSAPVEESLGTGFGKATDFNTYEVDFNRANPDNPDAVFSFYYDTTKNLQRMGVPVEQFKRHYSEPNYGANPFPDSPHVTGCKPPAGWGKKRRRR